MNGVTNKTFIDLRHLRHFIASAEHGSFRRAGAALGLSPSAVSRCIAELEDQIGASLFHRHTWGVSKTLAGERFLITARKAIRVISDGTHDAAAVGRGENGCVRIGIYSSIASGFLSELLEKYGERHPKVRIELICGNADEHIAGIRQMRLDVAFLAGTREWLDCERARLWSERIFVALPNTHPLGNKDTLIWQHLTDQTFLVSQAAPGEEVRAHLVREMSALGGHPDIHVQAVGLDNLIPLVALGRGLTLVGEAMTVIQIPGVIYRPILGEALPFSAVWSAKNDNPAFRRLLSLAKVMSVKPVSSLPDQNAALWQNHDPSQ
ncbi:LysR family transcriptional regulator [Salipiger thiooxidans]|uniref:LysR substrate-binding domain-containing protein n=1 Tax=Salipiger thiooxidans TaxID=282683 RepID=UPI001CD4F55B|nr:LysR family transcriptional regulator [Salipiger thiooxidans]MCA0850685.1 LysR family transcriptional regulator [Salipiger thiooxidans]